MVNNPTVNVNIVDYICSKLLCWLILGRWTDTLEIVVMHHRMSTPTNLYHDTLFIYVLHTKDKHTGSQW